MKELLLCGSVAVFQRWSIAPRLERRETPPPGGRVLGRANGRAARAKGMRKLLSNLMQKGEGERNVTPHLPA